MSSFQSGLELGSSFLNFVFNLVLGSVGFLLPFIAVGLVIIAIAFLYETVENRNLRKQADKDYAPGGPATK